MEKTKRIEYLKQVIFNLDMIDVWNEEQKQLYKKYTKELEQLENE